MRNKVNLFVALLVLLGLSLSVPAVADEAKAFEPYEAWYVLKLGGQRAGHMHASLKEVDGKLVNETKMVMSIKRGQNELRIEQASKFIETLDNKPIRSESTMKMAIMATEQEIDFTGEQWVITAKNAGQQTETKVDPPGIDWLTPGGMAAHLEKAIANGEKEITVTTLDPSMGVNPVTIEMTRGETADIDVFGRTTPATKWVTTTTAAPGVEIEQWTDESGQPVKQMIPLMPGMEVEMLLADKALALAEFDAPEMLAASFIKPDKPIKNPRKLKRAAVDRHGPAADVTRHRMQVERERNVARAYQGLLLLAIATRRSRSEFPMTLTDDSAIAAAATIGESSRPNTGNSTPAAIGTPAEL